MQLRGEFLWFLFIPFIVFLGLSTWSLIDKIRLFSRSTKVIGEVIGYEARTDPKGRSSLQLRVAYTLPQGEVKEVLSKTGQQPPREQVGERIPVWISRIHPNDARIGTYAELWLAFTIFIVIGGLFFIMWFGTWVGPPPGQQF
jgi:hypothetical protein